MILTPDQARRFWAKVNKTNTCWLWTAGTQSRGYGAIGYAPWTAHKFSYLTQVGPIPVGLTINHICGVKRCVRPDHLEAVTYAENNQRAHDNGQALPSPLSRTNAVTPEPLLDASMFKAAAGEVRRMLREDVRPVGANGKHSGATSRDTRAVGEADDATYVLARLKRDRPDLAAEVIAGTLTANAAAVDAGIRHRYARIRTDDLDQAVAVLCRHYDPQQIRSALEAAS